jgi:hypothetical protein
MEPWRATPLSIPEREFQGFVRCVKVQIDGKVLIGGGFSTVNGQPRSCFARLLSDGRRREYDHV